MRSSIIGSRLLSVFVLLAGMSPSNAVIAQSYTTSRLAGSPTDGGYQDGTGPAALFNRLIGAAVDPSGNVYITDSGNHVIRKVGPTGVTTTFAGQPGEGGSVDGVGSAARFGFIQGIAADGEGNLYVADSVYNTIRKVAPDGTVTTLAGSAGQAGSVDGVGNAALFDFPCPVAVDAAGNVYVGDAGYDEFLNPVNNKIRKIAPDGTVTTLAGSAQGGSADGTGSAAQFNLEASGALVVDGAGNVYVADSGNNTIRVVTPAGVVTTLAGSPGVAGTTDGTGSQALFSYPAGIALDSAGNIYVADGGSNLIRQVTTGGVVTTVAGQVNVSGLADGAGAAAQFSGPLIMASDGSNLYIPDVSNNAVRVMAIATASVTTLAGGNAIIFGSVDGTGVAARFNSPSGVATDGTNLYLADGGNDTIRSIDLATAQVTTIAGSAGVPGAVDGTGAAARFRRPQGVATDGVNLYVADTRNSTIRQVSLATGQVTTLAGSPGVHGSADGAGSAATFFNPTAIAASGGRLYVADTGNSTIRQIDLATAAVTTLAGLAGSAGSADGTGSTARFNSPEGVATDGTSVFVTDLLNYTIRQVQISTGDVSTLAGVAGSQGSDDGIGSAALFSGPSGIAINGTTLYVGDGPTLRTIDLQTGLVTTRVGTPGWIGGMDGTGPGPRLWTPNGIAVANNIVYIADSANDAVFRIEPSADIGITMTSNKTNPAVGANVTFTIKASNGGPDNATGVQVMDLLPAGLSFVSATPTQGTYTSGTGVWTVGAVNNGVTVTLALVAKVTVTGTIINTATKTAENETDLDPVNDLASVSFNKAVTTTTLVSSVNPSTFGQAVTFTATVTSSSGTPTGTVTFKRGGTILATVALSGGVAAFTTSTLPVGTGSITAAYGGDANFAPSNSTAVSQKVTKATTATTLAASPASSSTYGQSVMFTATVTSSGGVPAGTVTFKNGGASLGTATLVNGVASLTTTALPGGVRSITAVYGGDPSFATSTSSVLSFTVNPATTSTALATSQNPSVHKQPVTFTATVTSPGLTPTGKVKFMNGTATLATVALSGGSASLTTTALTVGSHPITAVYVGTANLATSTSDAIAQVVNPAPTMTALTTTPNPSIVGQQVTLTATVSSAYATPTGSVTFKDGAATLGTKALSSGVATLNTTTLSSGTHTITAVYAGTSNFAGSTSPPISQVVN